MKSYQSLIAVAIAAAMLSACATTNSPNAPIQVQPEKAVSNIPVWFISPPETTTEAIYVVGTAVSRDLSMSVQKASLDAETHLANKIAGEVSSMTKDYKREVGDEFTQSTEIVSNKIAAEVKIIGGVVEKKQITPEGGGFRTYVLIKYPLGSNNRLLQNHIAQKSFAGNKAAAEAELERKTVDRRSTDTDYRPASAQPVVNDYGAIVVKVTEAADKAEEN